MDVDKKPQFPPGTLMGKYRYYRAGSPVARGEPVSKVDEITVEGF